MNSPIPSQDERYSQARNGRSRLWLAAWLAKRPEVMARLAVVYWRARRWSAARRKRLTHGAAVTLAGAALLLALGSVPAKEEAITVVNGEVAIVENGKCSLIEAILNANDTTNGALYEDCAAGNPSGADTIVLPPEGYFPLKGSFEYTESEFTALPTIHSEITIDGNGSTIRRIAQTNRFRLMAVGSDGDLTVENTILANGVGNGGGINSGGDLVIRGSTFRENEDGAIVTWAGSLAIDDSLFESTTGFFPVIDAVETPLQMHNSTVTGNVFSVQNRRAAAVTVSSGSAYISNSTISRNNHVTDDGGAVALVDVPQAVIEDSRIINNEANGFGCGVISFQSNLTIRRSTLSENTCDYMAVVTHFDGSLSIVDSILNANTGNAIYILSGSLDLLNTTISGNSHKYAGGGIDADGSKVVIQNSTIINNTAVIEGGGIAFDAGLNYGNETTLSLMGTLITGNEAPYSPQVMIDSADNLVLDTYNLIGSNGDAGVVGFVPDASDVIPEPGVMPAQIIDPAAADNGGPTWTNALVSGSPAIDRIPSDLCVGLTDQRGYSRNVDGDGQPSANECDMGAFEFNAGLPTPTATATVQPTATPSPTPKPTIAPTVSATPIPTATATRPAGPDWLAFIPVTVSGQP